MNKFKIKKNENGLYVDDENVFFYFYSEDGDPFVEDRAVVRNVKDDTFGHIDREGNVTTPIIYKFATNFSEGLASVTRDVDYKRGYVDKDGKVVIPFEYESCGSFKNGIAVVVKNSFEGVINKKNEFILKPEYEEIIVFKNNDVILAKKRKFGVYDLSGRQLLPHIFDDLKKNGSVVKLKFKDHFIDLNVFNSKKIISNMSKRQLLRHVFES